MRGARGAIAVLVLAAPAAGAAELPSLDRGRLLYENHCIGCHTPQIHRRPNRIPLDAADLREIVNGWQQQQNLRWSAQDVEDVVQFLRETRYRF